VAVRDRLVAGERAVVQALQGMGGVGKTQLAVEYAYRFAGAYELGWWVDAEQAGLIGDQFAALGAVLVLAATLSAHGPAAFDVHGLAGLGGDDAGWRGRSGCAVAGVVVAAEEAGECVDGFEQQGVDPGLLVSGVLGVVARDQTVPPGGCLLLVLGGLMSGFVSCSPPAQCLGAGHGGGRDAGQSLVSSVTAFLAQASSTRSCPAAAAAMRAAVAALFRARGRPEETRCSRATASSAKSGSSRPARVM
jgi:hypothetical protein